VPPLPWQQEFEFWKNNSLTFNWIFEQFWEKTQKCFHKIPNDKDVITETGQGAIPAQHAQRNYAKLLLNSFTYIFETQLPCFLSCFKNRILLVKKIQKQKKSVSATRLLYNYYILTKKMDHILHRFFCYGT